jgi:hypothetical protein
VVVVEVVEVVVDWRGSGAGKGAIVVVGTDDGSQATKVRPNASNTATS